MAARGLAGAAGLAAGLWPAAGGVSPFPRAASGFAGAAGEAGGGPLAFVSVSSAAQADVTR